ncbi:MAG: 1-deoxy-D-xylulose-5-phosphate synthase [Clostridia bacterium]|nr:1-deoxy-D-xylulose-5-phosphate synthase [Clostridia bacterium]
MKFHYIDKIKSPDELKRICRDNESAKEAIADELRKYIIDVVTKNGGHLASNLGVIEITLALHLTFCSPRDSIVFDVGHQCYAHKILTGRFSEFETLRKKDGISGFPKRTESEHDAFNTGHSGTSVSAALGIARAKALCGDKSKTVALIGDGSMTSGMVFEALDDVGQSGLPIIIVLNDNSMAISKTVGALGSHLSRMRTSRKYINFKARTNDVLRKVPKVGEPIAKFLEKCKNLVKYIFVPNVIFENMGLTYIGTVDGHDINALTRALQIAGNSERPVIIHAVTRKGKGYPPAENDAEKYHGVSAASGAKKSAVSNSKVVGEKLVQLAKENEKIVAITAAMPSGTGLIPFSETYPERFFDVGIAEQHAVTVAAGMATHGILPFVAVYSTFFQRAYDQILHDVCLQNLPVVLGVDRAGLVGDDGETHHGVYDIAYLLTMPNMCIMSPSCMYELREMLELAFRIKRPVAVRYSRGSLPEREDAKPVVFGRWETLRTPGQITIIATGRMVDICIPVADNLGIGLVNARFINPVDYEAISHICRSAKIVFTVEDGITVSGFGARITQLLSDKDVHVYNLGVPSKPVPHASVAQQDELCGISGTAVLRKIKEKAALHGVYVYDSESGKI